MERDRRETGKKKIAGRFCANNFWIRYPLPLRKCFLFINYFYFYFYQGFKKIKIKKSSEKFQNDQKYLTTNGQLLLVRLDCRTRKWSRSKLHRAVSAGWAGLTAGQSWIDTDPDPDLSLVVGQRAIAAWPETLLGPAKWLSPAGPHGLGVS